MIIVSNYCQMRKESIKKLARKYIIYLGREAYASK